MVMSEIVQIVHKVIGTSVLFTDVVGKIKELQWHLPILYVLL